MTSRHLARAIAGCAVLAALVLVRTPAFHAASPVQYRFTFPEAQHRWMQVAATFTDLDAAPLELRMSRSSPGRYALHDFAKNVYDVHALDGANDGDGRELETMRPDPYGWTVGAHGSAVTVRYKVYGDRIDGTYLAVDETHAHINRPAAIMWARGLDDRPATLSFEPPAGAAWRVATQLHPASGRLAFTAPNLQYLMDSPVEFGPLAVREFRVGQHVFRFAAHHTGTDSELDGLVRDVEKIVQQEGAVFGEYPAYEPGYYTFLADYLPSAHGDGMEHRNSTVMTLSSSIAGGRIGILDTVAHEFFHCWNVERIRPRTLEPFDLERANMSGELWLAEGFTQYYGPLMLLRAGLVDIGPATSGLTGLVDTVVARPGRMVRSAEEMSRMAPFIDGGVPIDRTNWSNTVVSYYPFGGAIALALDLSLRERSGGRLSLDDFMRAMWRTYGKPGGPREGYVDRPYTSADAEAVLADVSGDRRFAGDFFARFIRGREVADYKALLAPAGFVVQPQGAGGAWLGDVAFNPGGLQVAGLVAPNWPAYAAGLDQDDALQRIDGQAVKVSADVAGVLRRHAPGDRVEIVFLDRAGTTKSAMMTLAEDPHVRVVTLEAAGGTLTAAQRAFRDAWLGMKRSN